MFSGKNFLFSQVDECLHYKKRRHKSFTESRLQKLRTAIDRVKQYFFIFRTDSLQNNFYFFSFRYNNNIYGYIYIPPSLCLLVDYFHNKILFFLSSSPKYENDEMKSIQNNVHTILRISWNTCTRRSY